jgi:hypothetical protein
MQSLLPDPRRSFQRQNSLFLLILMGFLLVNLWTIPKNDPQRNPEPNPKEILNKPLVEENSESKPDKP